LPSRPPARERLLDAVEVLLVERGTSGLTLDHVAERAGVSKGGLLYHFPSKAKLLDGLIDRLGDQVDSAVARAPSDPGEVVRWFISTSTLPSAQETSLYRALTAVLRSEDDLASDRLRRIFDEYASPVRAALSDPVLVETVRLIGDGLFLAQLLGLARPESDVLDALMEDLAERAGSAPRVNDRAGTRPTGSAGRRN